MTGEEEKDEPILVKKASSAGSANFIR